MSSDEELSSDNENNFEDDVDFLDDESELSEDDWRLSAEDHLFAAAECNGVDAAEAVQQAIRDGANVNAVRFYSTSLFDNYKTPLFAACKYGNAQIIRILLDAGADARWRSNRLGWSAVLEACDNAHLSTVQLLINHDSGLLEMADTLFERTPLFFAIHRRHSEIVRLLLDSGADPHHVDQYGATTLMTACREDNGSRSLEIVRLLLAAGVDVEARDVEQQTALHYAAIYHRSEIMLELLLRHNANMFAVDKNGRTPFDSSCYSTWSDAAALVDQLVEIYGSKLTHDHGRLALHELLKVAKYSFAEEEEFRPPLNPLQIILPLGKLTLEHLRTLLHNLNPELIHNRDDTGTLPVHIACQTNAPVEVLALILEFGPVALHIIDSTGALPIHLLCGSTAATEYASVRYLVEQGGVGTLAARDRLGLLPLHVLCRSTNPPLRAIRYLIQSFPGSVAIQTNAGEYPFMTAAAADSSLSLVSLCVVYELVRANAGLLVTS